MTSTPNQRYASLCLWMAELETKLAETIEAGLPKRTISPADNELWHDSLVAQMARRRARGLTDMATDYCISDAANDPAVEESLQ